MPSPNPPNPRLYFASSNPEKLKEATFLLAQQGIRARSVRMDLQEPRLDTVEEVAAAKALNAFKKIRKPVLAEDTGVFFRAYPDFPGVYAAYAFRALGFSGLLALLKGRSRGAVFRTALAYCDSASRKPRVFVGECPGTLLKKPAPHGLRGMRFPYERIFVPSGSKKALCAMTAAEKAAVSHRAKAFAKFAAWFNSR